MRLLLVIGDEIFPGRYSATPYPTTSTGKLAAGGNRPARGARWWPMSRTPIVGAVRVPSAPGLRPRLHLGRPSDPPITTSPPDSAWPRHGDGPHLVCARGWPSRSFQAHYDRTGIILNEARLRPIARISREAPQPIENPVSAPAGLQALGNGRCARGGSAESFNRHARGLPLLPADRRRAACRSRSLSRRERGEATSPAPCAALAETYPDLSIRLLPFNSERRLPAPTSWFAARTRARLRRPRSRA